MNRSVKTILDIMEIESNQNIEKQKEILGKIAEKINCPDLINSINLSTTDVGHSITKFSKTMWRYVNNEVIKNALNTVILALFNTLRVGDIIAFDPMLSNGRRRQCRFDIGQVVEISYPYDIEISVWKSITSTEYVEKLTLTNIRRDALRFKFADNPIVQNKIVLNHEIFTKITKNFYNGSLM